MANILVTGGAGYIGSHVCKALHRDGHTPISIDNLSRGFTHAVQWGPLIKGDVRDYELVKTTLIEHSIEGVIHLAAFAYVAESTQNPQMYFENNVTGMALLLSAMNDAGVKNILFSSSCATYGESQEKFIDETHPQEPINPYGLSKLMGEKMLIKFKEEHDFNICGLRYFNAAGTDPEGEVGENHEPEPHLIPTFIKKALKDESFTINGTDYPTDDGTCVRDFIHVWDLAQAHVIALNKVLDSQTTHDFYNVGLGKGYSLKEVAENIIEFTGAQSSIEFGPARAGDPAYLVCKPTRFQEEFGWSPKMSDMKTLLETAIAWENSRQ